MLIYQDGLLHSTVSQSYIQPCSVPSAGGTALYIFCLSPQRLHVGYRSTNARCRYNSDYRPRSLSSLGHFRPRVQVHPQTNRDDLKHLAYQVSATLSTTEPEHGEWRHLKNSLRFITFADTDRRFLISKFATLLEWKTLTERHQWNCTWSEKGWTTDPATIEDTRELCTVIESMRQEMATILKSRIARNWREQLLRSCSKFADPDADHATIKQTVFDLCEKAAKSGSTDSDKCRLFIGQLAVQGWVIRHAEQDRQAALD
jgi:hypothetical protein